MSRRNPWAVRGTVTAGRAAGCLTSPGGITIFAATSSPSLPISPPRPLARAPTAIGRKGTDDGILSAGPAPGVAPDRCHRPYGNRATGIARTHGR